MVGRYVLTGILGFCATGQIAAAETRCAEPPILAMSYNIRLDTKSDGANAWDMRKRFFTSQVTTLRPDILGLQEVLLNQKRDLEQAFEGYEFVGVGRDDGRDGGEFSPLAINRHLFRIGARGTFWLSLTPNRPSLGWDAGYKRVVSWARLSRRSDGAQILAINTHWDHQGQVARLKSSDLVRNWIARNQKKGDHIILLGDFNADETEASVGQLTQPLSHGEALSNSRATSLSGSSGAAISYNGFNAFPESGKLIDHIFVSRAFVVKAHAIIAAHENGRVASDHFPVVALLGLSGRRAKNCAF
jgi:endonuclease/exonuclease/phosphatase family metal-dependent hydrolase